MPRTPPPPPSTTGKGPAVRGYVPDAPALPGGRPMTAPGASRLFGPDYAPPSPLPPGALYYSNDVDIIDSYTPEVIAEIQAQLVEAGLIPKGTNFLAGVSDEVTRDAFREVLEFANSLGTNWEAALTIYASKEFNRTEPGDSRIIGGRVGGGNAYTVALSDPDTLNSTADKVAQAVLGRKATDEERARIVGALQGEERAAAQSVNTAREGQARTEFDTALGAERAEALVATGGALVSPVPGAAITDTLGADRDGGARKHMGTDIFGVKGSPAVAPIGGEVVKTGRGGKGGNTVWIKGDDGRYHYLAHFDAVTVKPGQRVEQGTQVGTVGNSGNATHTAPHVHYSINSKMGSEDAVGNPALELRGGSGGGQGAVRTVPSTYIPPVTTTVQEVDPAASAERLLREQNPTEAQAHDLANQFGTFLDLLRSPV